jgi:hypothetical protein
MRTQCSRILLMLVLMFSFFFLPNPSTTSEEKKQPTPQELVRDAVRELIKMQEKSGQWGYQTASEPIAHFFSGKYGYLEWQVAVTSIVAQTLLFAAPDDKEAQAAAKRGLAFVLKQLDSPRMASSTKGSNRVWGHTFALEFLCHVRALKVAGEHGKKVEEWIPRLLKALFTEECPDGGWNYTSSNRHSAVLTVPAVQALLLARSQGEKAPDEVFVRARKALESVRMENGAFVYDGDAPAAFNRLGGSASRSLACESTLLLLGGGSTTAVQFALDNFYKYWNALEKRRKKEGYDGHQGPYMIAPYYFYYGHRYAAQAIQHLPEKNRARERTRLLEKILQTRDADGTWNDVLFSRARSYGTSMVVLALLGDKAPLPPKFAATGGAAP